LRNAPGGLKFKGLPRVESMNQPRPGDGRDVRRYLFRLIALLALGAALMGGIATWAWQKYAGDFVDTTRPAPYPNRP
jgi:hypothetical protein